jgi:hypothetical protein
MRLRPEVVSIVGGGWSVGNIDPCRIPGTIIAVNDSAIHLPRYDIVVSMDRLWTEYRFDVLRERRKLAWLRRSAVQNLESRFPWLHVFECDHESTEFVDLPDMLNGTNSGFCAFNLAYQMRPKRIVLFGFDMNRDKNGGAYWYESYPWTNKAGGTSTRKYQNWAREYFSAAGKCKAAGIEILNASPSSAIEVFPKTDEFMKVERHACAS